MEKLGWRRPIEVKKKKRPLTAEELVDRRVVERIRMCWQELQPLTKLCIEKLGRGPPSKSTGNGCALVSGGMPPLKIQGY